MNNRARILDITPAIQRRREYERMVTMSARQLDTAIDRERRRVRWIRRAKLAGVVVLAAIGGALAVVASLSFASWMDRVWR